MNELILFLRVLFTPSCWVQNHPYSKTHDRWLRSALQAHEFKVVKVLWGEPPYEATIDGKLLWVENHPYASFTPSPMQKPRQKRVRPSRRTILLAYDKLRG